jgi:hypothetical protein
LDLCKERQEEKEEEEVEVVLHYCKRDHGGRV